MLWYYMFISGKVNPPWPVCDVYFHIGPAQRTVVKPSFRISSDSWWRPRLRDRTLYPVSLAAWFFEGPERFGLELVVRFVFRVKKGCLLSCLFVCDHVLLSSWSLWSFTCLFFVVSGHVVNCMSTASTCQPGGAARYMIRDPGSQWCCFFSTCCSR